MVSPAGTEAWKTYEDIERVVLTSGKFKIARLRREKAKIQKINVLITSANGPMTNVH